jgi:hypothetical protein
LFQGHFLHFAILGVVHVGGIPFFVVSGLGALMKTPDYKQEVQVQPWGDKNDKNEVSLRHSVHCGVL